MFDYAQLAIKRYSIISKSGGWFTLTDPDTGEILQQDGKTVKINGLARVYQYLENNPDYYEKIQKYIMNDLNNSDPEVM